MCEKCTLRAHYSEIYKGISGLTHAERHISSRDKDDWEVKDMVKRMKELLEKIEAKMK